VFIFAFAFGAVRRLVLEPEFGELIAVSIETPMLIVVMAFAARWVTQRIALSRGGLMGMGAFALALQQGAELALVYWSGQTARDYLAHFLTPPGIVFLGALIVFALMPVVIGHRKEKGAA